jgi:hypothetical protein
MPCSALNAVPVLEAFAFPIGGPSYKTFFFFVIENADKQTRVFVDVQI